MIRLGNFLFHCRNGLFPLAYVFLFAKTQLLFSHYLMAAGIGFAVALSGQLLRIATIGLDYIVRGGRNRQVYANDLVTGGLFSHCRNPLYVGNFLILIGLGIASCSAVFVFVILPLMAIAYRAIIAAEENFLRGKFGGTFDEYCARVSRVMFNPMGLGKTLQNATFHWPRVIVKEYGTTFSWTIGYILIVMQNVYIAEHAGFLAPKMEALEAAILIIVALYLLARFLKKREIIRG